MNEHSLTGLAVASSGLGHVTRGIEAWAADVTAGLRERGLTVRLYQGGGEPLDAHDQVVNCWQRSSPLTTRWLSWLPRRVTWRFGMGTPYCVEQTTFGKRLLKYLQRDRIRLLHVQDPLVARLVQRAQRKGIVDTRIILGHGTEEPLSFLQELDFVQHLAPWHLEQARRAGVDKPGWTAIPNFVNVEQFTPGSEPELRRKFGIPDQAVVLLVAAAIKRKHKRIDYVIDEFADLRQRRPDLPAWLVVAGGQEPGTDELIQIGRDKLSDRVRFEVGFPRAEMPKLFRMADLFALGSLLEMMPIALLEAIGSGLPCLNHHHPVMAWMSGPGGRQGDFEQPGGLSRLLESLIEDGELRLRLGRATRQHCVDQFSKESVVSQMIEYYESILKIGPKRQAA